MDLKQSAALQRRLKTRAPRAQHRSPGLQRKMHPQPLTIRPDYRGSGKLEGRVALISGGDSGIGRAVAVHFAREGADVCILYLDERVDAAETCRLVAAEGRDCLAIAGDASRDAHCRRAVERTQKRFGRLDVLVNNMGTIAPESDLDGVTPQQLQKLFGTNVFPFFNLTRHALKHLKRGAAIVNTCSTSALYGDEQAIDYAATKGAVEAFTYSLARNLADRGIRVNAVAPGAIWTPLLTTIYSRREMNGFGKYAMLKRVGHPAEVAPAYVYLASDDASFVTGHLIEVDGGFIG
jgi:NAD(P)-dependent dehydrogenase (short-subunit alcohol dehydrogenase family)